MSACNFEWLLEFVNKKLDLDKQLEVYDHLDRCNICRDAVYQLSRELAGVLFIHYARGAKHHAFRRQIKRAWSGHAPVKAGEVVRRELSRRQSAFLAG
jgi:hypothetical protein